MSSVDNTITETTATPATAPTPAASAAAPAPATETHAHHSGIIGKVEDAIHGITDKLHHKHDKPVHPEGDSEHFERVGLVGEQQELGTEHPEQQQGYGLAGGLGGPGAGPVGVGGPPRAL